MYKKMLMLMLVGILSVVIIVPSYAGDTEKVIGGLIAGYLAYEVIDHWNDAPAPSPPPRNIHARFDPPSGRDRDDKYWYEEGYENGFDDGMISRYDPCSLSDRDNRYWYEEGYKDGYKDGDDARPVYPKGYDYGHRDRVIIVPPPPSHRPMVMPPPRYYDRDFDRPTIRQPERPPMRQPDRRPGRSFERGHGEVRSR